MATLSELRAQVDQLDHQIIQLLAQRASVVQHIGELKTTDQEIVAPDRQAQIYQTRRAWAVEHGLDPDLAEQVYRTLIHYFIEQERRQLAERNPAP